MIPNILGLLNIQKTPIVETTILILTQMALNNLVYIHSLIQEIAKISNLISSELSDREV